MTSCIHDVDFFSIRMVFQVQTRAPEKRIHILCSDYILHVCDNLACPSLILKTVLRMLDLVPDDFDFSLLASRIREAFSARLFEK